MKRTVYIYERTNFETGVKKRSYAYTLNPEYGEVIGTKEVEVEEEPENNNNANNTNTTADSDTPGVNV